MAALTWVRFNVAVLGQQRNDVLQLERTDVVAALITVGYLSEVPAPPPPPVTPVDAIATSADVLSVIATALADPSSAIARAVAGQATAAGSAAAGPAASSAAAAAVGTAANTAATAALAGVADQLATVKAQMPRLQPKLRKWYAKLGNREAAPAEILILGDSISEGVGASELPRRWQNMLQRNLRHRLPTRGLSIASGSSSGAEWPYIPAHWGADWYVNRPSVVSGTWNTADSYGLGLRGVTLPDATGAVTFTFTGTSCRLVYTKGTGAAVLRVVIDGGAPVLIDSSANTPGATAVGVWNSPALARGTHTVVVTRDPTTATGRLAYVEGLVTWDGDEAKGLRVVDGAHSGSWVQQFAATGTWADSAKAAATGGLAGYGLAMILWGTNDFGGGRTAAQFSADTAAAIALLRARGFNGSIVLVLMWKGYNRDEAGWVAYGTALQAIADGDPDTVLLSLRDYMLDPSTADATGALGLYGDGIHPTDAGEGVMADTFAGAVVPR